MQAHGAKVGIFDADIYGPNVPLMLGVHRRREGDGYVTIARPASDINPTIAPLNRFGLKIMSTGLLVSEDQVINLLNEAVGQLAVQVLVDVKWGELDYLLLDLPPSSGQPQQNLMQRIQIDSAIVVTTPQDMSLLDASRAWHLFAENAVPLAGLVENMSYFVCPSCGQHHPIFSDSQNKRPKVLESADVLCKIPLSTGISQQINPQHPLLQAELDHPQAKAFLALADRLR